MEENMSAHPWEKKAANYFNSFYPSRDWLRSFRGDNGPRKPGIMTEIRGNGLNWVSIKVEKEISTYVLFRIFVN